MCYSYINKSLVIPLITGLCEKSFTEKLQKFTKMLLKWISFSIRRSARYKQFSWLKRFNKAHKIVCLWLTDLQQGEHFIIIRTLTGLLLFISKLCFVWIYDVQCVSLANFPNYCIVMPLIRGIFVVCCWVKININ